MRKPRTTLLVVAPFVLAGALLLGGCGAEAPVPVTGSPDSSVPSDPSSSATAPAVTPTAVPTSTAPSESPTATPGPTSAPPATTRPAESTTPALATVDVLVTYADAAPGTGDLEVGAYAAVVETTGTCSLEATSGSQTVTAVIPATLDASTTSCGGLTVDHSRVAGRTWQVRVTYDSATSHGTSDPVEVTVP